MTAVYLHYIINDVECNNIVPFMEILLKILIQNEFSFANVENIPKIIESSDIINNRSVKIWVNVIQA